MQVPHFNGVPTTVEGVSMNIARLRIRSVAIDWASSWTTTNRPDKTRLVGRFEVDEREIRVYPRPIVPCRIAMIGWPHRDSDVVEALVNLLDEPMSHLAREAQRWVTGPLPQPPTTIRLDRTWGEWEQTLCGYNEFVVEFEKAKAPKVSLEMSAWHGIVWMSAQPDGTVVFDDRWRSPTQDPRYRDPTEVARRLLHLFRQQATSEAFVRSLIECGPLLANFGSKAQHLLVEQMGVEPVL